MARARHDDYGKRIVRCAAGQTNVKDRPTTEIPLGEGSAFIDCTVGGQIAVEIESRKSKQVRGAVLDLICHSYPKKLLILLPAHMDVPKTKVQCEFLLKKFLKKRADFRVIACKGKGDDDCSEDDIPKVVQALAKLGFVRPKK